MSHIHEYPVSVEWSGGRGGNGSVTATRTQTTNQLSVPPEFGGTGSATNPEELLTSAIASCYSITFGIIADSRKLPVQSLKVEVIGYVEQPNPATFNFNKAIIRPTITLSPDASDDQVKMAEDMAHKADTYCIVTNAVRGKVEIVCEPSVVR